MERESCHPCSSSRLCALRGATWAGRPEERAPIQPRSMIILPALPSEEEAKEEVTNSRQWRPAAANLGPPSRALSAQLRLGRLSLDLLLLILTTVTTVRDQTPLSRGTPPRHSLQPWAGVRRPLSTTHGRERPPTSDPAALLLQHTSSRSCIGCIIGRSRALWSMGCGAMENERW